MKTIDKIDFQKILKLKFNIFSLFIIINISFYILAQTAEGMVKIAKSFEMVINTLKIFQFTTQSSNCTYDPFAVKTKGLNNNYSNLVKSGLKDNDIILPPNTQGHIRVYHCFNHDLKEVLGNGLLTRNDFLRSINEDIKVPIQLSSNSPLDDQYDVQYFRPLKSGLSPDKHCENKNWVAIDVKPSAYVYNSGYRCPPDFHFYITRRYELDYYIVNFLNKDIKPYLSYSPEVIVNQSVHPSLFSDWKGKEKN